MASRDDYSVNLSPYEPHSLELELLSAGKQDAIPPARREQLLLNLGVYIGAPPAALPDTSPAASAAQPQWWASAGAKLLGGGVLGALGVWGGLNLLQPSGPTGAALVTDHGAAAAVEIQPSDAPTVHAAEVSLQAAGSKSEAVITAQPVDARQPTDDSADERSGKTRVKGAANDPLARELRLIEVGRAELLRKQPSATLNTLEKYRKEFPKGKLRAEATVLRVEALIAKGDRPAALQIGEAFLRSSPNSPYSRRISSLLGGSHELGRNPESSNRR